MDSEALTAEALAALTKLFLCFPQATLATELQAARLAAYCEVLAKAHPRHVVAACQMAAEGRLGHPGYLPTAGELYQATQRLAADDATQERHERENAQRLARLKLPTPTPPQPQQCGKMTQEEIAAGLKTLAADIAKSNSMQQRATK